MSLTISVLVDPQDVQNFTDYMQSMDRRMARSELLPIMLEAFRPVAQQEQSFLADHTISGALAIGLVARAGAGDYPGTISVFSAPTATKVQLGRTWGRRGRGQQRAWAGALQGRGRAKVFYGRFVHEGHRIVKRNAAGELYDAGYAKPVPFARQAMEALGDEQADGAAEAILDKIVGTNG